MPHRSKPGFFRIRVWGTLTEPKSVTLIMVTVYALIAASGLFILLGDHVPESAVFVAALLMIAGGVLGVPSSWRGDWWLEGPAAVLSVFGVSVLSVIEAWMSVSTISWPHHTLSMSIIIGLFFASRAMRVWPEMYRPGRMPTPQVDLAKARMQGALEAERIASLNSD